MVVLSILLSLTAASAVGDTAPSFATDTIVACAYRWDAAYTTVAEAEALGISRFGDMHVMGGDTFVRRLEADSDLQAAMPRQIISAIDRLRRRRFGESFRGIAAQPGGDRVLIWITSRHWNPDGNGVYAVILEDRRCADALRRRLPLR